MPNSEFGLIEKIKPGCLTRPEGVIKAIGDDAAVFKACYDGTVLLSTDMLVEGIHFLRPGILAFDLGYKSLAVGLSDLAAMGAVPREAFVSIAIPANCHQNYIQEFYEGLKSLAKEFGVNILGGDTSASLNDLIINISVVGSALPEEILYRDRAQAGDLIYTTGFLGDSRAGLYLSLEKITLTSKTLQALVEAHQRPRPHLAEGRFLALIQGTNAAMDISDGLSSDIRHIMESSRVGARIYSENLPISNNLQLFCRQFKFDPLQFCLAGGEDYTLLVTMEREKAADICRAYTHRFQRPLYYLGEVTQETGIKLISPQGSTTLPQAGWQHFKNET